MGWNRYCGNVVTAVIQARGTQEGKLINIKEGSGCDQKDEDVTEGVTQAEEFHVKETLRDISPHWKLVQAQRRV